VSGRADPPFEPGRRARARADRCVFVDGIAWRVTADFDENDPEQMDALRALGQHLRERAEATVTDEMAAKQEAARQRIRERNARLQGEATE